MAIKFYAPNPLHNCFDTAVDPSKFLGEIVGRTIDGEEAFYYEWFAMADDSMSNEEIDHLPRIDIPRTNCPDARFIQMSDGGYDLNCKYEYHRDQ